MIKTIVVSIPQRTVVSQIRSLNQIKYVGGNIASGTSSLGVGTVNAVTLTNGGDSYTSIPAISFVGGAGSLAAATATISGGSVSAVTMTDGGESYTSEPAVIFTDGRDFMVEVGD